jgi:hypothetical protein
MSWKTHSWMSWKDLPNITHLVYHLRISFILFQMESKGTFCIILKWHGCAGVCKILTVLLFTIVVCFRLFAAVSCCWNCTWVVAGTPYFSGTDICPFGISTCLSFFCLHAFYFIAERIYTYNSEVARECGCVQVSYHGIVHHCHVLQVSCCCELLLGLFVTCCWESMFLR